MKTVEGIILRAAICAAVWGWGLMNGQAVCAAPYTLPAIPDSLTEVGQRAGYLAAHYWDSVPISSSATEPDRQTEQAFVDFIQALSFADDDWVGTAIDNLFSAAAEADAAMPDMFAGLCEKYLWDAESPVHNEKLYIRILEYEASSPLFGAAVKSRQRSQLQGAQKNAVGSRATDFSFTARNGEVKRLHALAGRYVILMFYDPDCGDCKSAVNLISGSHILSPMIDGGAVEVVAVSPASTVTANASTLPDRWTVGYDTDGELFGGEKYHLRSLPTIYLLDSDKNVILKDVGIADIERYMADHTTTENKGL